MGGMSTDIDAKIIMPSGPSKFAACACGAIVEATNHWRLVDIDQVEVKHAPNPGHPQCKEVRPGAVALVPVGHLRLAVVAGATPDAVKDFIMLG